MDLTTKCYRFQIIVKAITKTQKNMPIYDYFQLNKRDDKRFNNRGY